LSGGTSAIGGFTSSRLCGKVLDMALSDQDRQLLKDLYRQCDPNEPLQPDDPRYEPIYAGGHCEDPVARLRTHIEWAGAESLQLFSGFQGSGKTTELYRLRGDLKTNGAAVLYADALEYLNPSEPLDISDLLLVLAGAFSDSLKKDHQIDFGRDSWWARATNYLTTTSVEVQEVQAGLKAGIDIKLALKESSTFRQKLRAFLETRVGELKKEVGKFIGDGVKALRAKHQENAPVVLIFDQLERINGSASNENEVIASVERIFAGHLKTLQLPLIHAVYTVPPWLPMVLPGVDIELLPSLRLWKHHGDLTRDELVWKAARKLITLRLRKEGFARLFGSRPSLADDLIEASGGHFRDLLRLLREVLVRIQTQTQTLPASKHVFEAAIQRLREQYLPLSDEDAKRLSLIEKTGDCVRQDSGPAEVSRISRLLNDHLVLYFSNGGDWYDIHPLIREEVKRIVRRLNVKE
jgi:hypothetical protein